MTDFREIHSELSNLSAGSQRKLSVNSCVEVYFGYSFEKNLRLSFLSKNVPPTIESTKILHVVQGRENTNTYWTSFDLLNLDLKDAFLSFCENLVDSIIGIKDENAAMAILKRRYITWKTLFKKAAVQSISKEKLQGLFGELVVLKDYIAPKYGTDVAVSSWGGPDMHSKDFTVFDTWYEVKTVGANTDRIHISSLTQLDSEQAGHLAIVRVEAVSPEYTGDCRTVIDLIKEILLTVTDEGTENLLMRKIQSVGIDVFGNEITDRFSLKSETLYKVSEGFPRITPHNVPFTEITGTEYDISIAAISRFTEE